MIWSHGATLVYYKTIVFIYFILLSETKQQKHNNRNNTKYTGNW